jgi:hypothetical protein
MQDKILRKVRNTCRRQAVERAEEKKLEKLAEDRPRKGWVKS